MILIPVRDGSTLGNEPTRSVRTTGIRDALRGSLAGAGIALLRVTRKVAGVGDGAARDGVEVHVSLNDVAIAALSVDVCVGRVRVTLGESVTTALVGVALEFGAVEGALDLLGGVGGEVAGVGGCGGDEGVDLFAVGVVGDAVGAVGLSIGDGEGEDWCGQKGDAEH